MKNPIVSIVVPVYMVPEKFLHQCIESCVNQTLREIEIILVDDGSPDDCGKICDEYAAKDTRIKVIHKQNGGLVSARNAGFEIVTGMWHMYLDGDDWIDEDTCENLLNNMMDFPNVDVVFWNCIQELGDRSIKGKWEWQCNKQQQLYKDDDCKELARNVLIYKSGIATAYSKLINTSYAKKYHINHDARLKQGLEGTEFSLRLFYNASNALFLKEYYNHYRYNPDSISKRVDERNTGCVVDCLKVMEEDISAYPARMGFKQALYQRTVYALIAISMNTYFHPDNPDNPFVAAKKLSRVIEANEICKKSIMETKLKDLDKQRRMALCLMKMKLYVLLKPIATLKHKLLSKGYYNY